MKEEVKTQQRDEQPAVEVLESGALSRLGVSSLREIESEEESIHALAMLEHGQKILETRIKMIEAVRRAAIRATQPNDWVMFRAKDGSEVAMLARSGAEKVADYYGIQVGNFRPLDAHGVFKPLQEQQGDEVRFYGYCDARSSMTGRALESVEFGRSSSEDFVGRGGLQTTSDMVAAADLRASCMTNARTKAVRIIAGMARVPRSELEEAWSGTQKKTNNCIKGSGYGTSTERGAKSVTSDDVRAAARKLGDEVLARVGGDKAAAADLLRDITANPDKGFPGFDSIARLTKGWQVEKAWEALRVHPVHGDEGEGGGS